MEFEWDEGKDAANRAKHGVSLGDAALLDWAVGITVPDLRQDYGEQRWIRFAMMGGRIYTCAFAVRSGKLRIISLRKSNKREIRRHGTAAP